MSDRGHRRDRSRSPYSHGRSKHRDKRSHHERQYPRARDDGRSPRALPFHQRELTKHDLPAYHAMFALYLDIQKHLDIDDLSEVEVKGRWKSFTKKWNRGELAEGWYDPSTYAKAVQAPNEHSARPTRECRPTDDEVEGEDDLSDFGPALPRHSSTNSSIRRPFASSTGPTIPSLQDIQSRNEDARDAADAARDQRISDLRLERKLDRKEQRLRFDEIAPRAEAGTRERQLEKQREVAASNRAFAATKDASGEVEVQDSDLMGEDTLSELQRMKTDQQRRKTEREIRREEISRARAAEREERSRKMREKEAQTMDMLRELARARFGDGNERPATLGEHR